MTFAVIVAIVAAVAACVAAGLAFTALKRTRATAGVLDREIERGKALFEEVIAKEAELRAAELAETLALTRSEAISQLADEERRITEERRREVVDREREATVKLVAALTEAQRSVEARFADWGSGLTSLQQALMGEFERVGTRQQQLVATLEAKLTKEADRLEATFEEHRTRLAKVRGDLERAMQDVAGAVTAELESHSAERRRALQEVADRLRKRERELQEQIDREHTEASQRVAGQLAEVERRQVEQVRRAVAREAAHATEAAGTHFDGTIRAAREDAARRLARELDLSVERFAREAETVLAERVDSELRSAEARLNELARRLDSLSTRT
ncbi:MAG TPA: hypothetical protein VH063_08375 [Gaiellaceae bacterium]|nr:hypothetical protein [Gaiellaceae bacterium]